ncbi:MAG: hypothetical protein WBV90_10380 [Terrimicrobiaceae bacterium]
MSTPNPVSAFAVACRKLQEARAILHGTKLVKSGENKFANYKYFELADFLPATLNAFTKVGTISPMRRFAPEPRAKR